MSFKNNGFTLIELVIVIIILSAIGIATTTYISTGVSLYTDITERDKELNSTRFVMERLRRDVLNALPNSLIVSADKKCLTFSPIIASSIYGYNFPISPISASSATIAEVTLLNNETIKTNDRAVVYLLDSSELSPAPGSSPRKVHAINSINNEVINFTQEVSFTLSSPSKRLYIIRDEIEYCFSDNNIYRTKNSELRVLMANNIAGEFEIANATLQRNGLAKVTFMLNFDGQEVPIEQTLHVNNVP
jgi:MSHA biogenesis protein MshO